MRAAKISVGVCSVLLAIVTVLTVAVPAFSDEDGVRSFQVKVVQRNGAVFDAVVLDDPLVRYFQKNKTLNLEAFQPSDWLPLYYMYGLNGSMKIQIKRLESVSRLLPLSADQFGDMKSTIMRRINILCEKEKVRLAKVKAEREERLKQEMEAKAEQLIEDEEWAREKSEEDEIRWILRFPPDEGWGPEKKEELYHNAIVIGSFPNDEEKTFLDHYQEWLAQLPIWEKLQEDAEIEAVEESAGEEAVKEEEKKEPSKEEKKEPSKEEKKEPSKEEKKEPSKEEKKGGN